MAKLTVDLTGLKGLADGYYGNDDQTNANPQTQYLAKPGQMVDGFFNPFLRDGFLAPAAATLGAMTQLQSITFSTTLGTDQSFTINGVAVVPSVGNTAPSLYGAVSSAAYGTVGSPILSATLSHTVSTQTDRILVVLIAGFGGLESIPTGVTFNGVGMTHAGVDSAGTYFYSLFYLINPTATTANIVATWSTNVHDVGIVALTIQGVRQTNPISNSSNSSGTGSIPSVIVSQSIVNSLGICTVFSSNTTHTQASTQTEEANFLTNFPYRMSVSIRTASTPVILGSQIYDAINDDLYFAERGQGLFHANGLDSTSLVQDFDLGATGSPVIHDLEIYQINDNRKLFYTYVKGGNFNVGIINLPYTTNNATWLTGTVSGAFTSESTSSYTFMRVADNSFAYLFQDYHVHKIDGISTTGGGNGTATKDVLLFPNFFSIVDAIDYRGNMFICISQTKIDVTTVAANGNNFSTPCGVYVWDRQSTIVTTADFIPLQGVRTIKRIFIAPNGNIRLICLGANKLVQIREFNGSQFVLIKELGLGAAPQYVDSLTTASTRTYWLGTDGIFYAYGACNVGEQEILVKLGYVKAPSTSNPGSNIVAGAIAYGASNLFSSSAGLRPDRQGFTIAYKDTDPTIVKFFPFDTGTINGSNQLALAGNVYLPVIFMPQLSKINFIHLYHNVGTLSGPESAGTLSIFLNQSTTSIRDVAITRNDIVKGYKYIPIGQASNKNAVFGLQFKIAWDTSATMDDSFLWLPRMIEVDYEPITKLQ